MIKTHLQLLVYLLLIYLLQVHLLLAHIQSLYLRCNFYNQKYNFYKQKIKNKTRYKIEKAHLLQPHYNFYEQKRKNRYVQPVYHTFSYYLYVTIFAIKKTKTVKNVLDKKAAR